MTKLRGTGLLNLPVALTSFVGRERETAEVTRLLSGTRLLTLTGAGGCGKSRLALEVARGALEGARDGVWVVELAALSDANLVPQAVAAVLSVPEQPGRSVSDTLAEVLRHKTLLVVLDNCEHLLAACAGLAYALLRGCPELRILATSREPLGVAGETIWRVPSLSVPDPTHLPSYESTMHYEAVRLFAERAAAVRPGFRITEANAAAVVRVCHRLDGIPLAIELAAARVRAMSVEEIAARLRDRFHLLTGGGRMAPPRHQTLRAAMDWSYDLLSEDERVLLRRVSVFAGGYPLEAVEAVCSAQGVELSQGLDLLTSLVDKSLVNVETRGEETRYRVLETVRQYARDRLEESGGALAVRRAHRAWYLALAERANPALRGPEQNAWLKRLEVEHDNLRAALELSMTDASDAEAGPRLAWALFWFWQRAGYISEGREWLERMVAQASGVSVSVRARVLCGAGALSEHLAEYDHARARLEESLALFRQLDDPWGAGFALHFLAHVARAQGDFPQASSLFEKSLAYFRGMGDKWGSALTLDCWGGALINQGDYSGASRRYEESVALLQEVGDKWQIPGPLSGLGVLAAARGDYARATALLEESLAIAGETMNSDSGATTLFRLGRAVFWQGDLARSATLFKDSLALRKQRADKAGIAACLDALAGVAVMGERLEEAARLFGAAQALRETIRNPVAPAQRAEYDRHVASVQARLDETILAKAWAEGRAMGLNEAIEYARALKVSLPAAKSAPVAGTRGAAVLTPREQEVAALIAGGLTNREIASRLVIAERTAEGHVQSILNKLSVGSRAQIAVWAVEHGLRVPST